MIKRLSQKPMVVLLGLILTLGVIAYPVYDYVGDTTQHVTEQQVKIEKLDQDLSVTTDDLNSVKDMIGKQGQVIADQRAELEELKKRTPTISRGATEPKQVTLAVQATAYSYTGNKTKTGTWPKAGTIAVDPKVIPLGSRIYVPGYGYGIAEDTGGAIQGHKVDLFMTSVGACNKWGRQTITITVFK